MRAAKTLTIRSPDSAQSIFRNKTNTLAVYAGKMLQLAI